MRRFPFLAAFVLAGCVGGRMMSGGSSAIRTDRDAYVVSPDSQGVARFTIRLRYTNGTGKTAYLATCRGPQPPRLEKQVGDQWVVAFMPVVPLCLGVPQAVRAGDTFDYDFVVYAGMPGTSIAPRFSVSEVPGTYRVIWEVFTGTQGDPSKPTELKDMVPEDQRVSNPFRLVKG